MLKPMDYGYPGHLPAILITLWSMKYILLFVRLLMLLSTCMFYMYNIVLGAKYTLLFSDIQDNSFSAFVTIHLFS